MDGSIPHMRCYSAHLETLCRDFTINNGIETAMRHLRQMRQSKTNGLCLIYLKPVKGLQGVLALRQSRQQNLMNIFYYLSKHITLKTHSLQKIDPLPSQIPGSLRAQSKAQIMRTIDSKWFKMIHRISYPLRVDEKA